MSAERSNPQRIHNERDARRALAGAGRVVVKVGSAVLTGGGSALDRAHLHDLSASLARAGSDGRELILVSSGAVAAGLGRVGLSERPRDLGRLQAMAALGQPELMSLWRDGFGVRGRGVAQLLLCRDDFDARDRFLNIRHCIHEVLSLGVVPIVNENDTVATEEISLGDNDVLAAKLAVAVRAEALVILTSAAGVLDEGGEVVGCADGVDGLTGLVRATSTAQGRGGMGTKLEAARLACGGGVLTVIAGGRPADGVERVLRGEDVGTLVLAGGGGSAARGRRAWIGLGAVPSGRLEVDDGAVRALRERGASLLAKGLTGVVGEFGVGDVVLVVSRDGAEVGRGLSNLDASEARRVAGRASGEMAELLGRRVHEEVVHRDHFVLRAAEGD